MNETPATVRMIDGATAPAISNVFVNNACAVCTLQITGTFTAATVLVEGIVNVASNQWVTLAAFNLSDLSLEKDGADKAGIYQVGIEGILRVRMNVTAVSGGDITIAAQFGNATINQFSETEASNLIPITAYDLAVAGGYTGTLEQFETDMGNSASNATAAANSADEAANSAESVSASAAQIVTNTNDISDLKTHITTELDLDYLPVVVDKAINVNVSTLDFSNISALYTAKGGASCAVVACEDGDVFTVTAEGYGNFRAWGLFDSEGNQITIANSGVSVEDYVIIAPKDGYLIVNDMQGRKLSKHGKLTCAEIAKMNSEISELYANAGFSYLPIVKDVAVNTGSKSSVDFSDIPFLKNPGYSCVIVQCVKNDVFYITAEGYGYYRAWAVFDSSGNRTSVADNGASVTGYKLTVSANGYIIINDAQGRQLSYKGTPLKNTVDDLIKSDISNAFEFIRHNPGKNLFNPYDENIIPDKYIHPTTGVFTTNTSYLISGYIEVEPSTAYYFVNCTTSSAVAVQFYDDMLNVISQTAYGSTGTVTTPENARYMRVSITKANRYAAQVEKTQATTFETYHDKTTVMPFLLAPVYIPGSYSKGDVVTNDGLIYKANADNNDADFDLSHWTLVPSISSLINASSGTDAGAVHLSENALSAHGTTLAANTEVDLGVANIAKNVIYQLCCTFDSFTSIKIGHGFDSTKYASWVVIDDTNITVYANMGGSYIRSSVFAHGLTVANFLNVQIKTDDSYHCIVEMQTSDGNYTTTSATFYGNNGNVSTGDGQYYFTPATALTSYRYTVIFRDATKPIYLFGDSYMSFTNNRWVYYLKGIDQFDNVFVNAVGGANSARTVAALGNLNGKPKFALWVLGMNDSSDANINTPASGWMDGVTAFLAWCENNGCTPVFGTIPTTPDYEQTGGTIKKGKYNEGKNKWIRDSGYRYVDFAAALGADAEGNWYSGMLTEGDWVHPTIQGAIASFNRALADFPEIMAGL